MITENSPQLTYDLCIIGSGPAGIILALEYSRHNPDRQVLLLEYGAKNQEKENSLDNTVSIKTPLNHHAPYECTNKGFGGTSSSWGGRCVMFDEIDFMERPIIGKGCTWNIELYHKLRQYVPRAAEIFECGTSTFNLNEFSSFRNNRIAEGFLEGIVTDSYLEKWSKPTRFGKRYAKEIAERDNITLQEASEARTFSIPDKEGKVSCLFVRQVNSGKWQEIRANNFVLAAGAQENTRLLIRNKQLFNNLAAVPSALGKFYQGHVSGKIASVRFKGDPRKTDFGFLREPDGTYVRRRFQFSTQFLLKQNLLNTAIWLDNPLYFDPNHRSGIMSFMYLAMLMPVLGKRLAPPAVSHSVTKGKVQGIFKHILNIIKDLPASLCIPATIFFKRYCLKRKLPGVFLYNPRNHYALHFHAEQVPHPENRMDLGADGETLQIYYKLHDNDIQSVVRLHEVLDCWLRKCGCGELEYWYPKEKLPEAIQAMSKDGIHQSGTTRIADSPDLGVVDSNLKVWGTSNVFVCSSSVFPTSGQANPTFLLGVFALRLSEYLTKALHRRNVGTEPLLS